jgi:hypothetical protein
MEGIAQGDLRQPQCYPCSYYALDACFFFLALWRAGLAEYDEMEVSPGAGRALMVLNLAATILSEGYFY